MRHRKYRLHIAIVLLLALCSQALAAVAAPCGGMDNHAAMTPLKSMPDLTLESRASEGDMSGHGMHTRGMDHSNGQADCCQDSVCAQAGCTATVAALIGDSGQALESTPPTHFSAYTAQMQAAEPSSPFRPPISH